MSVGPTYLMGVPVYTSLLLVEDEEYTEVERLTLWQRWIEPISTFHNFQTMPWEPWVKTRMVTKIRQVPSQKVVATPQGYYMHPEALREVYKRSLRVTYAP